MREMRTDKKVADDLQMWKDMLNTLAEPERKADGTGWQLGLPQTEGADVGRSRESYGLAAVKPVAILTFSGTTLRDNIKKSILSVYFNTKRVLFYEVQP
ncbi:hypothetical protein NDU88_004225 [Pleurodeles waltl]|uniref:Uncharacterized protein n=1 Tax=Pleurodeles waltl TaxID=8319 RepID=A0AAV7KX30_PLEWA|nr:hypothetical protein NDU88_004225 [Pleurodeles waltl]